MTLDVIEEVTRRPIAHFEQLESGICKPTYLVHPRDTAPFVVQYVPPGQLKALEHELLVITMLEDNALEARDHMCREDRCDVGSDPATANPWG